MALPDEWTDDTVSVDDTALQYYRTGEGPPIVMAHGMFDHGRRWVPLAERLAEDYEVIAYDARGHGRSDAPETGYDIDTRVTDLLGVLDGLDVDDPVLLGHSMGAATVAWAAATNPDLPRGVVLADPSRFPGTPEIDTDEAAEIARQRLEEAKSAPIDERIEELLAHPEIDREHAERLAAADDECSPHVGKLAQEHPPVRDAFEGITVPTLLLRRDVDDEQRSRDRDAAEELADGQLVHVDDAGHYVTRDAPDAAGAELETFLDRL
jgi:pimeloyl-ACP methyl ester carboxylesterase